jgi:hypothetical protein
MNRIVADAIYVLEGMFVVGLLGSAVVWVLTTVEDVIELFLNRDRAAEPGTGTGMRPATVDPYGSARERA